MRSELRFSTHVRSFGASAATDESDVTLVTEMDGWMDGWMSTSCRRQVHARGEGIYLSLRFIVFELFLHLIGEFGNLYVTLES